MSKSDAGKGDAYRPVDKKKYDENYDRIFNRFVCAQLVSCNKCENTSCVRKKKDEEKEDDVLGNHNAGNSRE